MIKFQHNKDTEFSCFLFTYRNKRKWSFSASWNFFSWLKRLFGINMK